MLFFAEILCCTRVVQCCLAGCPLLRWWVVGCPRRNFLITPPLHTYPYTLHTEHTQHLHTYYFTVHTKHHTLTHSRPYTLMQPPAPLDTWTVLVVSVMITIDGIEHLSPSFKAQKHELVDY